MFWKLSNERPNSCPLYHLARDIHVSMAQSSLPFTMSNLSIPRTSTLRAFEVTQSELRGFFRKVFEYETHICKRPLSGDPSAFLDNHVPWKDVYALSIHLKDEEKLANDREIARKAVRLMTGLQELSLILNFRAHVHAVEYVRSWWWRHDCPIRKLCIYDGCCCPMVCLLFNVKCCSLMVLFPAYAPFHSG